MNKPVIKKLVLDSYLAFIKNSIGSKMFRNFYAMVDGKKQDIMKNGWYSCAFYVSSVLLIFKLIKEPHATVNAVVEDLKKSGWKRTKRLKPGCVIVWDTSEYNDGKVISRHKHIGFYIDSKEAVSTHSLKGMTVKHHYTFKGNRKIESIFWNPKLK